MRRSKKKWLWRQRFTAFGLTERGIPFKAADVDPFTHAVIRRDKEPAK